MYSTGMRQQISRKADILYIYRTENKQNQNIKRKIAGDNAVVILQVKISKITINLI